MSTLKADTIQSTGGGAATLTKQAANKGYLNFDASSVYRANTSPYDSFNFSSNTDGGTGIFAIAFTNAMSDANFGHSSGGDHSAAGINCNKFDARAAGTFNLRAYNYAGSLSDNAYIALAFQGDLA
jgi:hypothetical protein